MSERTVVDIDDIAHYEPEFDSVTMERQRSIPWCWTHDMPTRSAGHKRTGDCEIVEGRVWEVVDTDNELGLSTHSPAEVIDE